MSLQTTIYKTIMRQGQPATVTWQASTDLSLKAPKPHSVPTVAYVATKDSATAAGEHVSQQYVYLPILERSIMGATITINGRKMTVTDTQEYVAGARGPLMQRATVV
jgi:transcriptional regulator GlxA family with amidase domain